MEEKNAQEKKDNDFLELIKKIEKNMKKYAIEDIRQEIAFLISIMMIKYDHLKRVKYMLEVQLSRAENNLPDLSMKELRELVIKNGYMTEDLEYDINTRKRLKLKEYYDED